MIRVKKFFGSLLVRAVICVALTSGPGNCLAQNKTIPALADPKAPQSDIQQFCINNAAIIGNARVAWQTSKLLDLEAQIGRRLAELETKKSEYAKWLSMRDDAMKQATDSVVTIYAHMRPDASALQLVAMDDAMAAAILAKLPPRVAGAILNEMEAGRAARLTRSIGGRDVEVEGKKS